MDEQRGHFWIAMAGAFLWVLRARFFRLEVRRFGTAMAYRSGEWVGGRCAGRVECGSQADPAPPAEPRRARSASHRVSVDSDAQSHEPTFRLVPHFGQRPL